MQPHLPSSLVCGDMQVVGGAELSNKLLALSAGEGALCAGRTGPWGDRRQLKAHLLLG